MTGGRELTIRLWEHAWGREGLWCKACRRKTPVEQLLLEPSGRAVLPCEGCGTTLRTGASWLTTPPAPLPRQRGLLTAQA